MEREKYEYERMSLLIEGARQSGFTIDYLEALSRGLSLQAIRKLIANASSLPSIMKSSDSPYVRRRASAPTMDRRE